MRNAILAFISHQTIVKEELALLNKTFREFDKNGIFYLLLLFLFFHYYKIMIDQKRIIVLKTLKNSLFYHLFYDLIFNILKNLNKIVNFFFIILYF